MVLPPEGCPDDNIALLTSILNQDIATGVRISQIVQAFEVSNGAPQTNQGELEASFVANCGDSEEALLQAILDQRQANFNGLQRVLLAV